MARLRDILCTLFKKFKIVIRHPEPEEEQGFLSGIDEELECLDPVCLADRDHLRDRRVLRQLYGAEKIVGPVVESEEACAQEIVLRLEMTVYERFGASCNLGEILCSEALFPVLGVGFDGRV